MDIRKLQKAVITALQDIKAVDIQAYDVTHLTSLFDRVVIATANSVRQAKSLARSVHDKAREHGVRVYGLEGDDTGEWVLVDLGAMVVHIMLPAVRSHYNLEDLWNQPKPRAGRKRSTRTHASVESR